MSDVATAAKTGKGTLYEYFRSKEDLFSNLLIVALRESLETLASSTVADDPEKALRATIRYVVKVALEENLDLYRLLYDFWGNAAAHRAAAQKKLREVAASWRDFVAELVKRGQRAGVFRPEVDADLACRALSSAVDGLSLQIILLGERVDLDAYARQLEDLFLSGLMRGGPLQGASILREPRRGSQDK